METDKRLSQAHAIAETRDRKTQFYDSWSKLFDQDMLSDGYSGPSMAADAVAGLYPGDRENVHILDIAAGTGFVGEQLAKHGFVKVDALDPSQGMLDKAKAKGVYQTLICSYFDEKKLDIAPGQCN
ncbi:Williams-Beuren syndrome chromosomal region 27 protein [Mizuhopecten yessoensis]|uniref:Williams-Beuren syndrome chromosomal region 27 protein n=1 Tax=Mizuhopecten yessoensis TaxID=6573 RepID=A0A210Q9L4_MIZYE|nr:Williams-Beuren syndrome chromosomal region 27 protein [Mizuhopecten yessoensis]